MGLPSMIAELRSSREAGLVLLLLALGGLFSILLPGRFATLATMQSMMYQLPELGLLCLAMAFPIISGGFNLAIVATANATALLMAAILVGLASPDMSTLSLAALLALTLAAGAAAAIVIGVVTGHLVSSMGVHPILVTLGTMSLVGGISVATTRGAVISGFPAPLLWLGNGTVVGIPLSFVLLLLMSVLAAFLLGRTVFGVNVYMIGTNLRATAYSGVSTRRVLIGVYTVSSLYCWVAGLVMMARFNSASAGYADSYMIVTILAAVLGGIDPFGGFGRISGLVLALFVLQVVSTGFNLLGANQHLTTAVWGCLLLVVFLLRLLFRSR